MGRGWSDLGGANGYRSNQTLIPTSQRLSSGSGGRALDPRAAQSIDCENVIPHPAPNDSLVIPLSTADAPDNRLLGGVISIGNFDGVHRGHARLIGRLCELGERFGGPVVAVTFDPPPGAILRPRGVPPRLTTLARREELLKACGVSGVVVIKTSQELLNQSPEVFFRWLVVGQLQARGIVEGPNFFFGRNRQGNPHLLQRLSTAAGIECEIVEPTTVDGLMASSTRIREWLIAGDVAAAAAALTAPYRIRGRVVAGAKRGRELGFPTANLAEIETLLPAAGVYAGVAHVDGRRHRAAIHLGPNPTFDDREAKLEVHLLDYSADLYGRTLDLDFITRVRDVRRFESAAELTAQLAEDLEAVRAATAA